MLEGFFALSLTGGDDGEGIGGAATRREGDSERCFHVSFLENLPVGRPQQTDVQGTIHSYMMSAVGGGEGVLQNQPSADTLLH